MTWRIPRNEDARLAALRMYAVMDSAPESSYDDLTLVAAQICNVPISAVSLLERDRQWFKSRVGIDLSQTPRELAFCNHAIQEEDVFVVEDATADERFASNPLVTSDPNIRFYAGAPLVEPGGHALGTLCVIDRVPRRLDAGQRSALQALARQVVRLLELRRVSAALADALGRVRLLSELVPVCAWCKHVRDDAGFWASVEDYIRQQSGRTATHGICPKCLESHFPKSGEIDE